jgi:hypothetical protein
MRGAVGALAAVGSPVGGFVLLGVLDPALAANLRWLADYKHPRNLNPVHAVALTEAFAQPAPLMEGVRMVGDPIAVLPSMFHMLWSGTLDAGLSAGPLGGRTLVRMRTVR